MDFSSFEVCLWTKPESDQLQACMICLKRGQRNTILWIKAYGWMRFHRDTLSVFRWFKPLSHDRDLGCHWQRKFPSVFAAVVCLQLSICHCCDVEKTAQAPHWLCHLLFSPNLQYICTDIHPSIHPSMFLPPGLKLSLHFYHAPPSTPLRSGRHRNGWFRKGGRVSQSSCCFAPCGAFTVHFCFCAAFMALICWQFRWLSQMLYNCISYTKPVCSLPSKDMFRI